MRIISFSNRSMHYSAGFRVPLLLAAGLLLSISSRAQAPAPASIKDPFVLTLVIIMAFLALVIGLLAYIVLGSADLYLQKQKEQAAAEQKKSQPAVNVVVVLAALLLSLPSLAQDKAGAVIQSGGYALSDTAFYLMTGVIFVELLVIAALLYNLRVLLEIRSKRKAAVSGSKRSITHWWSRMNKFKPVEQEGDLDMGHEYDGIRELDNRLPPWWLYGFYACIVFSVIYLWRYHVSHSAPSSKEEYELAVKEAETKRAAYLKQSANNVDENTVKYLPEAGDLSAGQKIFETACFACHGKLGEGGVGPNLTDPNWLHGGSVQDIFKTIKYGVPEKGMKSWKDDYSPLQLAQLTSYIISLKGTNPPNGKAAQGEIYEEKEGAEGSLTPASADSTAK